MSNQMKRGYGFNQAEKNTLAITEVSFLMRKVTMKLSAFFIMTDSLLGIY